MRDIAIHVDTLGRGPTAPVLAIAAVQFDRLTGKLGGDFYMEVELNSVLRNPAFQVDGETMRWWMDQSPGRRRVFLANEFKKNDVNEFALPTVLDQFSSWGRGLASSMVPWTHRTHSHDINVLDYAYLRGAVGLQPPYGVNNMRDLGTLLDVALAVNPSFVVPSKRSTNKAPALNEAIWIVDATHAAFTVLGAKVPAKPKPAPRPAAAVDDPDPL